MEPTMNIQDVVRGSAGKAYAILDNERYLLAQITDLDTDYDINISEMPIMGRMSKGSKPGNIKYTGKATFYYNTSLFRKILKKYQDEGIATYFDIQVTAEDKSASIGRQTIILKKCFVNVGKLARLSAGSDFLEEDISFTFDSFEMPEEFSLIAEMQA